MKKFRIVGLLLVLCLISSSFVGVTFAKYTSTATKADSAVVAKWSFTVNNTDIAVTDTFSFDLFNTIQDDGLAAGDDAHVDNAADNNADTQQIIAPGTGGSFVIVIANLSQVKANYKVDFVVTNDDSIPLQYSLDKINWETNINDLGLDDGADLNSEQMGSHTTSHTIYWRWVYDGVDDVADTNLGIDANTPGTVPFITVEATFTATQVD